MMDESLTLARTLTGAAEDDAVLAPLCTAAKTALERQLRPGVTAGECNGLLPCATALLAAADWQEIRQDLKEKLSYRAGEVSVTAAPAAEGRQAAAGLRQLAWRMMEPYMVQSDFCFQGI